MYLMQTEGGGGGKGGELFRVFRMGVSLHVCWGRCAPGWPRAVERGARDVLKF